MIGCMKSLFIDMVLNEDIEDVSECMINDILYVGFVCIYEEKII